MNNFLKVSEMSQNRLNGVGIDLTSVPAKFEGPGTSRTVTLALFQNCPNFSPKYPDFWSQTWDSDLGPLICVPATFVG